MKWRMQIEVLDNYEIAQRTTQQCKCADRLETELADATKAED